MFVLLTAFVITMQKIINYSNCSERIVCANLSYRSANWHVCSNPKFIWRSNKVRYSCIVSCVRIQKWLIVYVYNFRECLYFRTQPMTPSLFQVTLPLARSLRTFRLYNVINVRTVLTYKLGYNFVAFTPSLLMYLF